MGRGNWLPHRADAEYVYVHDVYEGEPESHDQWWYSERYKEFKDDVFNAIPTTGCDLTEEVERDADNIVRIATYHDEGVAVGSYDDEVYVVVSVYPILEKDDEGYVKACAKVKEVSAALFDQLDEWHSLTCRACAWTSSPYVRSDGSASKYKTTEVKLVESTRYIQVKAVVKHIEGVDPEEILNNCHYEFKSNDAYSSVKETELQEYAEKPWQ